MSHLFPVETEPRLSIVKWLLVPDKTDATDAIFPFISLYIKAETRRASLLKLKVFTLLFSTTKELGLIHLTKFNPTTIPTKRNLI